MNDFNDDLRELIESLGLLKCDLQNDELFCLCPFHNDKSIGSFSININTGLYHCFSCFASGSILSFAFNKGISYNKSLVLWNSVKKDSKDIRIPSKPIDKYFLDQYIKNGHPQSALERVEWDVEILKKYHIYCDDEDNIVFFVPDPIGRIRSIMVKYGKKDIPLANNYWRDEGYFCGNDIDETEYTIIVEGIWDACYVNRHTNIKTLAIGSCNLTDNQLLYLKNNCKCIFLLDGDTPGKLARDHIHSEMKDAKYESFYCGKYNDDPDQIPVDKLNRIIRNAKSWGEYEIMRHDNK